jgi:hypothetical protein
MFGDSHLFSGAPVGALSKSPTPLSEPNQSVKLRMWWLAEPRNRLVAGGNVGLQVSVCCQLSLRITKLIPG